MPFITNMIGRIRKEEVAPVAVVNFVGAVADQAAMLALTPDTAGDYCIREDVAALGIYLGGTASSIDNWLVADIAAVANATTSVAGLVKKAAAISASAPHTLTDNIAGTVSTSAVAILQLPATVLSVALSAADFATYNTSLKNTLSTIVAEHNLLKARLEELISKKQTAGQLA